MAWRASSGWQKHRPTSRWVSSATVSPALFLTESQTLTIQSQKHPKTLNPTAYQTFLTKITVETLLRVFKTLTFDPVRHNAGAIV